MGGQGGPWLRWWSWSLSCKGLAARWPLDVPGGGCSVAGGGAGRCLAGGRLFGRVAAFAVSFVFEGFGIGPALDVPGGDFGGSGLVTIGCGSFSGGASIASLTMWLGGDGGNGCWGALDWSRFASSSSSARISSSTLNCGMDVSFGVGVGSWELVAPCLLRTASAFFSGVVALRAACSVMAMVGPAGSISSRGFGGGGRILAGGLVLAPLSVSLPACILPWLPLAGWQVRVLMALLLFLRLSGVVSSASLESLLPMPCSSLLK